MQALVLLEGIERLWTVFLGPVPHELRELLAVPEVLSGPGLAGGPDTPDRGPPAQFVKS